MNYLTGPVEVSINGQCVGQADKVELTYDEQTNTFENRIEGFGTLVLDSDGAVQRLLQQAINGPLTVMLNGKQIGRVTGINTDPVSIEIKPTEEFVREMTDYAKSKEGTAEADRDPGRAS